MSDVAAQIAEFAAMPKGWHFGEGVPTQPNVSAAASALLEALKDSPFELYQAFPGIDGELQFGAKFAGGFITIEIDDANG